MLISGITYSVNELIEEGYVFKNFEFTKGIWAEIIKEKIKKRNEKWNKIKR